MSNENRCADCGAELATDAPQGLCPGCLLKRGLDTQTFATEGRQPKSEPVPPAPAELAAYFPDLEIIELLGRGGMGVVYKARQKGLDRLVALKILSPKISCDPAFAERFMREARAMARLSHPHIVAVYDFGQTPISGEEALRSPLPLGEGQGEGMLYYFLMEFVDGLNLRQLLDTDKLAPQEALAIVPQICDALQYAHDSGVVHRDIKPENILLDKSGQVKIADFGIAKLMQSADEIVNPETPPHCNGGALGDSSSSEPLTAAGQVIGTPQYMAPEQLSHPQSVDHRADIYSLGVVFYQMLTGELPTGRFDPPSKKVLIDVRLDEVVLRALEKEPEHRYQQAGEVKTHVETIVTTPSSPLPLGEGQGVRAAGAGATGSASAWPSSTDDTVAKVSIQIKGPAIGLLVTGILNWVTIPLGLLLVSLLMPMMQARGQSGYLLALVPISAMVFGSLMIFAALKMKRLQAYGLAVAASILAIIISPGNLIGLPIGIWALVVLSQRDVRAAFRRKNNSPSVDASVLNARKTSRFAWKLGVAAAVLALAGSACILWMQRPLPLGNMVSQDSPDGRYSALAGTRHAMRILGGDRLFYRFTIQGPGGAFFERREVPIPIEKLSKTYLAQPIAEYAFGKYGHIEWAEDSSSVRFLVRDVEVFSYDLRSVQDISDVGQSSSDIPREKTGQTPQPVLTYEIDPNSLPTDATASDRDRLIDVIDRRINVGRVMVARIEKLHDGQIEITLLRQDDATRQRVERLLARPGTLELRILATNRDHKEIIELAKNEPTESEVLDDSGKRLAWWVPVKAGEEKSFANNPGIAQRTKTHDDREVMEILVVPDIYNITSDYLTRAKISSDHRSKPCVLFTFNEKGGNLFSELTRKHLPDKTSAFSYNLGIVLDGELYSAPSIQSVISDKCQITGDMTEEEVSDLVDILNSGVLPTPLQLLPSVEAAKHTTNVLLPDARSGTPAPAIDMRAYRNKTNQLVRQEHYQEALERFVWFDKHALEHDSGMSGVRVSFALRDWKKLGDVYPPAKRALIDMRDRKTRQLEQGQGSAALFQDVMALNRTLGENAKTLQLFRKIESIDSAMAAQCWHYAKDVVFLKKQYDIAKKYIEKPLTEYDITKAHYDLQVAFHNRSQTAGAHSQHRNQMADERFVKECLKLIEFATAIDDKEAAQEIRKRAASVVDDPRLREDG